MQSADWINGFSDKKLSLIIFTTEKCNFRCRYCYEDFKIGKLSEPAKKGILRLIETSAPELDSLDLSFFGGEPLLNHNAILQIMDHSRTLSKKLGFRISGSITTNGYLLGSNMFFSLFFAGVTNYQITIDGDPSSHNNLRPLTNNKPTFDVVFENVLFMLNSGMNFKLLLRINVYNNKESIKNFLEQNKAYFINDKRVVIHFHKVFINENIKLDKQIEDEGDIEDLWSFAKSLGYFIDHPEREGFSHTACYASKINNWTIRADGRVQKCTVALENDINNVGYIDENGSLNIDNSKIRSWTFSDDKSCPLSTISKLSNIPVTVN